MLGEKNFHINSCFFWEGNKHWEARQAAGKATNKQMDGAHYSSWSLMQGYKAEKLIIQYKADKSLSNRYVLDKWWSWHSLDPVTGCDMEDIFTDSLKINEQ